MSASTRRSVSRIAGWRASHGPNRHHTFHVSTRTAVSMRAGGSQQRTGHAAATLAWTRR